MYGTRPARQEGSYPGTPKRLCDQGSMRSQCQWRTGAGAENDAEFFALLPEVFLE